MSTIDVLVDGCGSKVHDDIKKADLLNVFFASSCTDWPDINAPYLFLRFRILTYYSIQIYHLTWFVKTNKAGGPDKISFNALGECKSFDVPLPLLYNQSSQTGCFHQDWKDANVNPLFKKDSRLACSKYRPISPTKHIVKLLKIILFCHILELIRENNTFSRDQHWFQEM